MKCFRIDISRKLLPYLHGVLSASDAKKIEQHLSRCTSCKAKANRLLEGDALARLIPAVSSKENGWSKLEAAISREQFPAKPVSRSLLRACAVITALSITAFFGWRIGRLSSDIPSKIESDEYRAVAIREMPSNTEPHVVTEGYISEVRFDYEDGDLLFKLVESLERPSPFVICEIIPPSNLNAPSVGERVRVYGVSRYDPKENHQWYEVHPVVGIEKIE
jgi:Putative zinc-finger